MSNSSVRRGGRDFKPVANSWQIQPAWLGLNGSLSRLRPTFFMRTRRWWVEAADRPRDADRFAYNRLDSRTALPPMIPVILMWSRGHDPDVDAWSQRHPVQHAGPPCVSASRENIKRVDPRALPPDPFAQLYGAKEGTVLGRSRRRNGLHGDAWKPVIHEIAGSQVCVV
jgi:hypothetical protein